MSRSSFVFACSTGYCWGQRVTYFNFLTEGTALHCTLIPVTYSIELLLYHNVLGAVLRLSGFLASECHPGYMPL